MQSLCVGLTLVSELKIFEGKHIIRTFSDSNSYTSNKEIKLKIRLSTNPVTKSVYRGILKHRAQEAIMRQPYV